MNIFLNILLTLFTLASSIFAFRKTLFSTIRDLKREFEKENKAYLNILRNEIEELFYDVASQFNAYRKEMGDTAESGRFFVNFEELDDRIHELYKKMSKFYEHHFAFVDPEKRLIDYKKKAWVLYIILLISTVWALWTDPLTLLEQVHISIENPLVFFAVSGLFIWIVAFIALIGLTIRTEQYIDQLHYNLNKDLTWKEKDPRDQAKS